MNLSAWAQSAANLPRASWNFETGDEHGTYDDDNDYDDQRERASLS
jgi:hypothetical protein